MLFVVAICGLARPAPAEDWPMYGHDGARSQTTAEPLGLPLRPCWVFQPRYPPAAAWDDPRPADPGEILELRRNHVDDTFQVAVAAGAVYFGSSVDNKLFALDAATGRVRWTKITGAPVRLAPSVADGRVYFGSDDGYAYCLAAADGALRWQFHAAPEDRYVLGHGRMISLWPLRTGVLVDGAVAYFGAGVFPAEGVFLYAVNARSGREIWRNDSGGEAPQSRISPQGYLLASPTTLYAPMGRAAPASFDRADGRLIDQPNFGKTVGGAYALLSGQRVYTGTEEMVAYGQNDARDRFAIFDGRKLVATGDAAYLATGTRLLAIARRAYPAASQRAYIARKNRTALAELLYNLKRDRAQLLKDITRLDNEIALTLNPAPSPAPRPKGGRDEGNHAAAIDSLRRELADKQRALGGWPARYEEEEEKLPALDDELKRAQRALDALYLWDVPCPCDQALILAGNVLFAGGAGQVLAVDAASGKTLWTAAVEGSAKGLAAAAGHLFVSTDKGPIYCFGPAGKQADGGEAGGWHAQSAAAGVVARPTPALAQRAAATILHSSGVRRGYCLVLGCETGELAVELARQSALMVYAVSPDAEKVAQARRTVDAAGLYGARVCVEQWPLEHVPYSDYFANLIVSETALLGGPLPPDPGEMFRMLKPVGGVALFGPAAEGNSQRLADWLAAAKKVVAAEIQNVEYEMPKLHCELRIPNSEFPVNWLKIVRGPLPGAGSWTHLYGNPGNTACGDDQRVKSPLGVLWFGHPGPGNMVNRHSRSVAPLSIDGRLFCEGENVLMAYDAYNGLELWTRHIPGALRTGVSRDCGNMAVDHQALYAAVNDQCLRIDPAGGATLATYGLPETLRAARNRWGYVGLLDEELIGSCTSSAGTANSLFAIAPKQGRPLWIYRGNAIVQSSIALGDGKLFFVDGRVTALDARSGRVCWRSPIDLSDWHGGAIGTMLSGGKLVVFGTYTDGHNWQQFFAGQFASRRVTVLASADGKLLWSRTIGYRVRPLIIGNTLHAEPWAFDLDSGAPRTRINPVTGQSDLWQFARPGHHCGCPSASPNCLFFRSYSLGYYDLAGDFGTQHFGGQRPGCWINFIPAAGLLLMPEASAGCMCAFPNMCSVVFEPKQELKGFGFYSTAGPLTPVRRLAVNFGAPGDRNDAAGQLWLGYPRPAGTLGLPLQLDVGFCPGGGYVNRNSVYNATSGTADPWLFASAARGLTRCAIRLLEPGDGAALYRVRLAMTDPHNARPGQRLFDVKLQGRRVLADCDIAGETGGPNRALVKEFSGIEVAGPLLLELVPKSPGPLAPGQMPILQGIEVLRERVVRLGCALPRFQVNNREPSRTGTLQLTNLAAETFRGQLEIIAPPGFVLTPKRSTVEVTGKGGNGDRHLLCREPEGPFRQKVPVPFSLPVEVAGGTRRQIELTVRALASTPPGVYPITVRVLRRDGIAEVEQATTVEHLGRIGRLVIPASEDSFVSNRYPDLNKGDATVLVVNGGENELGDIDHTLAFLKFRLNVPGRPTALWLRLTNAGDPTGDAGRICLVDAPWHEKQITYANRPPLSRSLARIGPVAPGQVVECPLDASLAGRKELSLALDPTSCDSVDYVSREGAKPPALVIQYEQE